MMINKNKSLGVTDSHNKRDQSASVTHDTPKRLGRLETDSGIKNAGFFPEGSCTEDDPFDCVCVPSVCPQCDSPLVESRGFGNEEMYSCSVHGTVFTDFHEGMI